MTERIRRRWLRTTTRIQDDGRRSDRLTVLIHQSARDARYRNDAQRHPDPRSLLAGRDTDHAGVGRICRPGIKHRRIRDNSPGLRRTGRGEGATRAQASCPLHIRRRGGHNSSTRRADPASVRRHHLRRRRHQILAGRKAEEAIHAEVVCRPTHRRKRRANRRLRLDRNHRNSWCGIALEIGHRAGDGGTGKKADGDVHPLPSANAIGTAGRGLDASIRKTSERILPSSPTVRRSIAKPPNLDRPSSSVPRTRALVPAPAAIARVARRGLRIERVGHGAHQHRRPVSRDCHFATTTVVPAMTIASAAISLVRMGCPAHTMDLSARFFEFSTPSVICVAPAISRSCSCRVAN
jgi:hypothetical protein